MQYKNDAEKSNVATSKTLGRYSDKEFAAFCYRFWNGEHPELTYQEIDDQKAEIAKEQKRRSASRWKKRLPILLCVVIAVVFSVFFWSKSLLVGALFLLAASMLLLIALFQRADPISEDEDE